MYKFLVVCIIINSILYLSDDYNNSVIDRY